MDPQNKRGELIAAWRALADHSHVEGWRTIPVVIGGPCMLRVGRYFPGNEEAILFAFSGVRMPSIDQLPQGRGFRIVRADIVVNGLEQFWIALCRKSDASAELFVMMAEDVISVLQSSDCKSGEALLRLFIARVRAWQYFMSQGRDEILSAEAEVGLFGELLVLETMIGNGVEDVQAVESWQGPLDGIHDFVLGSGAVEVKSTISPTGFPVKINSLEQLDDSLVSPLFLTCVRLGLDAAGQTLTEKINQLRRQLNHESDALGAFDNRLIQVGFFATAAHRYMRRFNQIEIKTIKVSDSVPRLVKSNVATGIVKARYEIDIDFCNTEIFYFETVLHKLGIIT